MKIQNILNATLTNVLDGINGLDIAVVQSPVVVVNRFEHVSACMEFQVKLVAKEEMKKPEYAMARLVLACFYCTESPSGLAHYVKFNTLTLIRLALFGRNGKHGQTVIPRVDLLVCVEESDLAAMVLLVTLVALASL